MNIDRKPKFQVGDYVTISIPSTISLQQKTILRKVSAKRKWARICKVYHPDEIADYFIYRVEFTNKRGVVDQALTPLRLNVHVWMETQLAKVASPLTTKSKVHIARKERSALHAHA